MKKAMTRKLEDILDEALDQLKDGATVEAVLFNFDQYRDELAPLLEIIHPGIKLPLKEVPRPALQRKYLATHPEVHFWNRYLSFTKLALMPLSVILVFCAAFTAQANPGQTLLYGVKHAVQKAPLAFIRNPDVRAAKELELSEKTLDEAQEYIDSNNEDKSKAASVIASVAKQTSETVAAVREVAKEGAISGKNHDLLNKLVAIAEKQERLANTVQAAEDQPEATVALEEGRQESTKTVAEVNNLVATVNEQTLANLKDAAVAAEAKPEPAETPKPAAKSPARSTTPISPEAEQGSDPEAEVIEDQSPQVSGNFILEYPEEIQ